MSIGRRFIDLAKSELNSLLDKAAELGRDDDDVRDEHGYGRPDDEPAPRRARGGDPDLSKLSDEQLQAELERRSRERIQREARARVEREAAEFERQRREKQQAHERPRASPPRDAGDPVRKAYAALEVPYGADFDAVKKSYRTLMRKYHPDRHTGSPDKQKAAHELTTKLTAAYHTLEKHLGR
jgi:DnaJ-domain-containing protein 1